MPTLDLVPIERVPGYFEKRDDVAGWELATGTLACPGCDAPVLPGPRGMSPGDALDCPFCSHTGFVRDFLSLGEPTRPTHVVVRLALRPA